MKLPSIPTTAALLALSLSIPAQAASDKANWSYTGDTGPHLWHTLHSDFAGCKSGRNQSPVNLTAAKDTALDPLQTRYATDGSQIVNKGHTIQVNFTGNSELTLAGHTYALKQVHFHAPSENQLSGEHFPLEAHFVHADDQGSLAVLALMFRPGSENAELSKAWQALPLAKGQSAELASSLNAGKLLPESLDYYRFNGSLTTPPCTEGVKWLVLKQAAEISAAQLKTFNELLPHANNRPVQPLNARVILE